MYAWIWRMLPFGFWGRLTGSIGLIAATGALLWYVIFPWATPLLPFDDVQVGSGTEQQAPAPGGTSSELDEDPNSVPYSTESNAPHPSDPPSGSLPGN